MEGSGHQGRAAQCRKSPGRLAQGAPGDRGTPHCQTGTSLHLSPPAWPRATIAGSLPMASTGFGSRGGWWEMSGRAGSQPGRGYPSGSLPQGYLRLAMSLSQMVAAPIKFPSSTLLYPPCCSPQGTLVSSPGSCLSFSVPHPLCESLFINPRFRLPNSRGPFVSFFELDYLFGPL